jgi:hypothetical protein
MTKKSNLKPDFKGGFKPIKKGSTLSSIMKLGGVSGTSMKAIGKDKGGKSQPTSTVADMKEDGSDTVMIETGEEKT